MSKAREVNKVVNFKRLPYPHLESDYFASDLKSLKLHIEALLEMVEE